MNPSQILYVDDERENLTVFHSIFKKDYGVLVAESAQAAFEILQRNREVQLVITDQRMPNMTGVEFLERIVHTHPDMVRVILTGYTDVSDIISAINYGKIYHYATKPWNRESLKVVIDKALEYYGLKKKNADLVETLREKNDKLVAAIDELEMFLYRSSHDLKGPLSSILGLINLAKVETEIDALRDYVAKLEQTSRSLDNTLNKLTKINIANLADVAYYEVDVQELIGRLIGAHQAKIQEKDIDVLLEGPPARLITRANAELLFIALEALLENAIEFSKAGGAGAPTVAIRWRLETGNFYLDVKDHGDGIDPAIIEKIFDPFFRGHVDARGNGLGLYVAQKAIRKLGGEITVASKIKGGSVFTVMLPALNP